jgi:hypothetical protein
MRNRKRFGIYLHGNAMSVFNANEKMVRAYGTMPPVYVDASQTSWVDSSTFLGNNAVGPRQVVAMNNLRYNITTYDGNGYSILESRFESSLSVDNEINEFPYDYILSQNYPNPFNPVTVITYQLFIGGKVSLKVYDIIGNEITTLLNEEKPAGTYKLEFNGHSGQVRNLPSGVYFYRLFFGDKSTTKPMILLK